MQTEEKNQVPPLLWGGLHAEADGSQLRPELRARLCLPPIGELRCLPANDLSQEGGLVLCRGENPEVNFGVWDILKGKAILIGHVKHSLRQKVIAKRDQLNNIQTVVAGRKSGSS